MNYLERFDLNELRKKPLSDFTASELASLLVQKFPNDPFLHLYILWENKDISSNIYNLTQIILKGAGYDTTENNVKNIPVKDSFRRCSFEIRTTDS